MRNIVTLFILILGPSIVAQDVNNSPYDVIYNHLYNLEPGHRLPEQAAASFHPSLDLETRIDLAENTKQILDARGIYIHVQKIPRSPDYIDSTSRHPIYTLTSEIPQITVEKYGDQWYYSKEMSETLPKVFKQTFPAWSLSLLNNIPESMKRRVLGIQGWKLIGLLLILLGSFIAFKIFEKTIDVLMEKSIWKRLKIGDEHLPKLHRLARLLGIVFFLLLIRYLLPTLMLEIHVSKPLFKIINILIIFFLLLAVLKAVDIATQYVKNITAKTDSKTDDQLMPILSRFVKVALSIAAVIRILYLLDVNVTALIAGLSIGGLALALAAQDTVKNLIGSAMIFFDKPFQIGDYIFASDFEGTVEEVGFRSSKIRRTDTSVVTVPNASLTNTHITNFGIRKFRIFETYLGFTYNSKADHIKSFILDVKTYLSSYEKIQPDNNVVTLRNLSSSSIDVFFRVFIDANNFQDELTIREEIIYVLMEKAKKHNLSFAFPSTSIYVENIEKEG